MSDSPKYQYDLEDLARDVAFEIELGGFRLDPSDVSKVMLGVSQATLDLFKERVLVHCQDFAPGGKPSDFSRKSLDEFVSGVVVAESLGIEPQVAFSKRPLYNDKGMYFMFKNGTILECEKATRFAMWGKDFDSTYTFCIKPAEAARAYGALLLSHYGKEKAGVQTVDFVSPGSLKEGLVLSLRCEDNEHIFVGFDAGEGKEQNFLPLKDVFLSNGKQLITVLQSEYAEENCLEYNRLRSEKNIQEAFCQKADFLLKQYGAEIMLDHPYLQLRLLSATENGPSQLFIRKSVDIVNPENKDFYIVTSDDGLSFGIQRYDKADISFLKDVICFMDAEVELLSSRESLSSGINFENGPQVVIPYSSTPDNMMIVTSVYMSSLPGELLMPDDIMVSGRPVSVKDDNFGRDCVFRLCELTDKGILAVRAATDEYIHKMMSAYPRPELGSIRPEKKSGKVRSRGVE